MFSTPLALSGFTKAILATARLHCICYVSQDACLCFALLFLWRFCEISNIRILYLSQDHLLSSVGKRAWSLAILFIYVQLVTIDGPQACGKAVQQWTR